MHPANHEDYTKVALDIFQQYLESGPVSQNVIEALCDASGSEDDPELQRGLNWHFYNNGGRIRNNPLIPGTRTSENRVKNLAKDLGKAIEEYNGGKNKDKLAIIINLSGRLLHHIQDMSTPSHVVPVYHGLVIKDNYERFGKVFAGRISAAYSLTEGSVEPHNSTVTISKKEIEQSLARENCDTPIGLYEKAAEDSLKYLDEVDFELKVEGKKSNLTWKSFWRENGSPEPKWNDSNDKNGFGTFGICGNNFGTPYFVSNDNFYEINHLVYLGLFQDMFKKSVIDSIVFLKTLKDRCDVFRSA